MKKFKFVINMAVLVLLVSLTSCKSKTNYPDLEDGLYAEFVTKKDTMVAKLFFKKAPVTVANFVALAEGNHPMVDDDFKGKRFYDGITFHRVINNFMAQGGDPTATGTGNSGYRFEDEFSPDLKHSKKGILAMANSGPNTNGSQFYITHKATEWLNAFDKEGNLKACGTGNPPLSCHAVFGELVINTEKITSVQKGDTLLKLTIIRKGFDAKKFNAVKTWETELPLLEESNKKQREEAAKITKEKADAANKIAKEKSEIARNEFIKQNKNLKGNIKHLPTGLAMIFIKESKATKPKSTESVLVNYAGYFEDGRLFDTCIKKVAKKNGQYKADKPGGYKPFKMIYNETATLVPGFREAMLNMVPGDKARVFIPSYLGYGSQGSRGVIPPNTNLVFDLEIMGIAK